MLDLIIKFLDFENIDKQLLNKIPYHLFLFIGLSLVALKINFTWQLSFIQVVFFLSLFLFLLLNSIVNFWMNKLLNNYLDYAEFDKFIENLNGILDGTFSILSNGINRGKVYTLFVLIIGTGFSLLIFNLTLFALIFFYLEVSIGIQLIIFGLLSFYIYHDILKLDFLNKQEFTKGKYSFEVNLLEKMTVSNLIESNPHSKYIKIPLFLGLRVLSPLISLNINLPFVRNHLVYRDKGFEEFIKEYLDKKVGVTLEELSQKEERCYPLNTILTNTKPPKLTSIFNQPLKHSFPYLYDSKYHSKKGKDPKIKYTILKIVKKPLNESDKNQEKRTIGYIFLHLFHGAYLKTTYSKNYNISSKRRQGLDYEQIFRTEVEKRQILFILLTGERDFIKSIEMRLQTLTQKVPKKAMGIDMIDED